MELALRSRIVEECLQARARVIISCITFFFLLGIALVRGVDLSRNAIIVSCLILAHPIFATVWLGVVNRQAGSNRFRLNVVIFLDLTTTTLVIYWAGRFGAFFYPLFLWIIVGNGLRFGKRALLVATMVAFVEFGLVLWFNPIWQRNLLTGLGLWWGIVCLPAFFLTVLNRLGSLNSKLQLELGKSQAATRAKGEFLANMSHEIRTPLNGILGMTQILGTAPLDRESREHVQVLQSSADSLLAILNDVLDFSKISSGKMRLESVPFDLSRVLGDVVQLLQPGAEAKGLALRFAYPDAAPRTFVGDPTRVRQIVTNLVGNAIKFTDRGSVSLEVAITAASVRQSALALSVIDTGIGIPPDRISAVFEQFEQASTATNRSHGGTGLGLSISSHLARMMAGDIRVESTLGQGSRFQVDLTLRNAAPGWRERDRTAALPRFDLRVLVAEDNAVNQLVIRKLLEKVGIRPEFAGNGQEAIAALERAPFDLVFMDLRMPVMDGLEATRILRRRDDELAEIPIIALTADADSDSARRCLDAGMNSHLGKPVILAEAVAAIERLTVPVPVPGS